MSEKPAVSVPRALLEEIIERLLGDADALHALRFQYGEYMDAYLRDLELPNRIRALIGEPRP